MRAKRQFMAVRRAQKGDIPAILMLLDQVNEVHAEARPDIFNRCTKYTAAQLEDIISDINRPLFVYDEDDAVLGYAMCKFVVHSGEQLLADIKTLYIDDICVDEGARGRGIGTALYKYAAGFAKTSGCYNITLTVWACNPAAEAFYKKLGLVPQRTMMEQIL